MPSLFLLFISSIIQGGDGRFTLNNGIVALGVSTYVGGAVDSVMYNGMEFVQSLGHGRQIQVYYYYIIFYLL
jgi:hypothetical protein